MIQPFCPMGSKRQLYLITNVEGIRTSKSGLIYIPTDLNYNYKRVYTIELIGSYDLSFFRAFETALHRRFSFRSRRISSLGSKNIWKKQVKIRFKSFYFPNT